MIGRCALVVGADTYPKRELNNAIFDALRVEEALTARGFSVSVVLNPKNSDVDEAFKTFRLVAQTAELAVIYLAGHAVERHGNGYFLPVDFNFPPAAAKLRHTSVCLKDFIEATNGAKSRIVVLDACRNWPQDPIEALQVSNDLEELAANERDWPDLCLPFRRVPQPRHPTGSSAQAARFQVHSADILSIIV